MSIKGANGTMIVGCLAMVCAIFVFAGCSEKGGGFREPNKEPDTFISFGPKEDSLTYFKVQIYWYGTDEDGDIDRFEVVVVEGDQDTLDLEALSWGSTSSRESTFVLVADECCLPASGDVQSASRRWGVLVRAIDNDGGVDPIPASLFFEATNVIPKVAIRLPKKRPGGFETVPPHPYIEWVGDDPDGEMTAMQYKYIVIPDADLNPTYPRLPPLDFEGSGGGHASPPVGTWSEWVPADCTFVKDLDLSLYAGTQESISVYVTAKDEGGAFLPEKLYGPSYNQGRNWIRLVIIETGAGVTLEIEGGALGTRSSKRESEYKTNIAGVFQGTEVSFRFWAKESRARGEVAEAYRYFYDREDGPTSSWNFWTSTEPIRDRAQVPEWFVRYPVDGSKFIPTLGRHVFVVELRDLNKVVTHCEFGFEVLEGPWAAPERKILLVDDNVAEFLEPKWGLHDEAEDSLWADILEGYNWEQFDTGPNYQERLPIRFVSVATTVIWVVDEDLEDPATHLLRVMTEFGQYLSSYVKVGGNLIIIGRNPIYAHCYWPDGSSLNHDFRSTFTSFNFSPKYREAGGDTMYNFNWEILGIAKMAISPTGPEPEPFNGIVPCEGSEDAWQDTIEANPEFPPYWSGEFGSAFYITDLREATEDLPFEVRPMYTTAYRDTSGKWTEVGTSKWIAVYVPGDGERGYAAYIGFPPYWFDHSKVKAMIRNLLEIFGEHPRGS